jgi:hypothetical protein
MKHCACGGGCPRCQNNSPIQTKLAVSQPGDSYEQEADRVADQIMRSEVPEAAGQSKVPAVGPVLQRQSTQGLHSGVAPPIVTEVLRSAGQSLDGGTRSFFEPRLGVDLSGVRVHTDAKAAESARAVDALAYTVGQAVVFGREQYAPGTVAGRRLLAHELTHVLQQNHGNSGRLQRQTAEPPEAESVVDSRIDVRAQFALQRLFRRNPPDNKDARDLFNDVKSGKIKGIYGDDLAVAAILAGERGKSRWELVPKGQDAVMMDDEYDDTPVIVFKESAGEAPRLDQVLLTVYRGAKLSTTPKKAPPAFKLPPKPATAPGGSAPGGCTFSVSATLDSDNACPAPLCGTMQHWKYTKVNALPPCSFEFNENDQLIEEVSSDGNCTGLKGVRTGLCAIAPNGSLGNCTDSYGVCKPPDQIKFGAQNTCTETMTQKMSIGGLTNRFFVEGHTITFTFVKSGIGCSATAVRN